MLFRSQVKGTDLGIGLFELAGTQDGQRIHLESTSSVTGPSWPNACHICEIELTPQTGEVRVDTYSSVNDVGRVVNPMIVVGQLDGGAIQGIGQALIEAVVYDPESGQLLTGSLMDYAAPRADITPVFRNEMDQSTPCKKTRWVSRASASWAPSARHPVSSTRSRTPWPATVTARWRHNCRCR